jgi:hypothetical protein
MATRRGYRTLGVAISNYSAMMLLIPSNGADSSRYIGNEEDHISTHELMEQRRNGCTLMVVRF